MKVNDNGNKSAQLKVQGPNSRSRNKNSLTIQNQLKSLHGILIQFHLSSSLKITSPNSNDPYMARKTTSYITKTNYEKHKLFVNRTLFSNILSCQIFLKSIFNALTHVWPRDFFLFFYLFFFR